MNDFTIHNHWQGHRERVKVLDIETMFGSKVFGDREMEARLPREVYASLKRTAVEGSQLDPSVAEAVAVAMKDWALEQGATHYTHWFQPMTGITAGKHDSFVTPTGDGRAIFEFSSKALIHGEPDASSFPSGGLRATFEARGYTAWDPTSPAFVREDTLYIPTAFCAYNGEALDQKTPLLRATQAISKQAVRLCHICGLDDVHHVMPMVGAEQEYFLVDRAKYESRLDLKICGRTMIGARPPKGQELEDHYCGRIKLRVAAFMRAVDHALWELGIASKTKHNEAAPAQHELAPVYEPANLAADHNQLTMEVMRIVAKEQDLSCLFHEKPFAGINGSGKHNNFSLSTDTGIGLLAPGHTPESNLLFLVTLCAVIRSIDRYADLLRLATACPGNDFRLGACEAPPAIISIFLGEQLSQLLEDIAAGGVGNNHKKQHIGFGVNTLPELQKDDNDRNRTSPFAFTGNKFEFRMLGASQSIAFTNVILCTILAESLDTYCGRLEDAKDLAAAVRGIVAETVEKHGRVIYNGNNYSTQWQEEAKRRGLPILGQTVDALHVLEEQKNIDLFAKYEVLSPAECHSRHDILMENYVKVVGIEAATMTEMVQRQVLPATVKWAGEAARALRELRGAGFENAGLAAHIGEVNGLIEEMSQLQKKLSALCAKAPKDQTVVGHARMMQNEVRPAMERLRKACDAAETIVARTAWPMPTYTDLLHRV